MVAARGTARPPPDPASGTAEADLAAALAVRLACTAAIFVALIRKTRNAESNARTAETRTRNAETDTGAKS